MPDSRAYTIAKQFATWASDITVANGYSTDAGLNIFLGRRFIDAESDKFPCLSILWAGEWVSGVDEQQRERANITVTGFAKLPAQQNDNDLADALFQDIRNAIKLTIPLDYVDTISPSAFEILQPDADSQIVRASMTYAATYHESYGV